MSATELLRLIFYMFYVAMITRIILSFVIPMTGGRPHPIVANMAKVVYQITEPVLAPIRRVLPTIGMFDLSPMVAIIILQIILEVVIRRL